jgi:hypothetical protein
MKKSIYCIIDANDKLDIEMDQIQGGAAEKTKIGTIKCKDGTVTINKGTSSSSVRVQLSL